MVARTLTVLAVSKIQADVALVLPFGDRRLPHATSGLRCPEFAADRGDGAQEGDPGVRERHASLPHQIWGRGLGSEDLHVDWRVAMLVHPCGDGAFRGIELQPAHT